MAQEFLFSDFTVSDDDDGVTVDIMLGQKPVPFTMKRAVTIHERQRATDKAFKKHFSNEGKVVVDSADDGVFSIEVVLAGLLSWPFTNKDGSPVPITREAIGKLPSYVLDDLSSRLLGMYKGQEQALIPFAQNSDNH